MLVVAACCALVAGLTTAQVLPCGAPLHSACDSVTASGTATGAQGTRTRHPRVALKPLPAPKPGMPLFGRPGGQIPFGLNTSAIEINHDDRTHRRGASPEAIAIIHQQLGATLARVNLFWPTIEPAPHRYTWRYYDRVYSSLVKRGVRPIWTLVKTPRFYVGPLQRLRCTGDYCDAEPSAANRAELAAVSRRVADRYPLSAAIELRNEPNNPAGYGRGPKVTADEYTAELQQVFRGTRRAGTSVRVLGGALGDKDRRAYLEQMLRDGAAQAMDGLSFHPYDETSDFSYFHTWFDAVDQAMKATGTTGVRLVATETGVTTDGGRVSDAWKAARIVQIYEAVDGRDPSLPRVGDLDAILFYTAVNPVDSSHGYGWFVGRQESSDGNLQPKAVVCEFHKLTAGSTSTFAPSTTPVPGERISGCPG